MPDTIAQVPLMPGLRPAAGASAPLIRRPGQVLSQADLLAQAVRLAAALPSAPFVINLCEDRGIFILALCAALVRGVQTLLPPNRLVQSIEEIVADYPGALCLSDAPVAGLAPPAWLVAAPADPAGARPPVQHPAQAPVIAAAWEAILVFTSGSTGKPQPHPKRWGDVMACAAVAARRFGIGPATTVVATVPPQHMYGLELSVAVPLAVGAAVDAGRPFFPEDLRLALARVPAPRVLVTTPIHLAACVDAMGDWPEVALVISATAPLSGELAGLVEERLGTRVCEIYGCTEAGSIASRRTLDGPHWQWYDSASAAAQGERCAVTADFLPAPVPLSDILKLHDDGTFQLLGRGSDMVKIAGKRASLADLNLRLNAIPGVTDGVFVIPAGEGPEVRRLAVVAVAPELDRAALLAALRERIDPCFLPRTLVLVDRLPRNETGKCPRERLLELVQARGGGAR